MKSIVHMLMAVVFALISSLAFEEAHGADKSKVYGVWEVEPKTKNVAANRVFLEYSEKSVIRS